MNRKPNLDMKIVAGIEKSIGLSFVPEKDPPHPNPLPQGERRQTE